MKISSGRDLLKFSAFLRDEKELHPRTVYNKFENVMSFLKAQGFRGLVGKNDWPRYVEEEPEVYEREDLDTLFAACDATRAAVVRVLPDDGNARTGSDALLVG